MGPSNNGPSTKIKTGAKGMLGLIIVLLTFVLCSTLTDFYFAEKQKPKLVLAFSALETIKKTFKVNERAPTLRVLDGVRSFATGDIQCRL